MKLTVISWNYLSGSRHFAKTEIDTLQKNGYLYRLITRDNNVYDSNFKKIITLSLLSNFLIKVIRLYQKVCSKFINKKLNNREKLFDFVSSIFIGNPELVYLDKTNFSTCINKAKKKGINTIAFQPMVHNLYTRKLLKDDEYKSIFPSDLFEDNKYDHRIEGINKVDNIIAHSQIVKNSDIINGRNKDDIRISYGCVDTELYFPNDKLRQDDDIFRVIFVGNELLKKGYFYLFEAWKELNLDKAELIVVGKISKKVKENFVHHSVKYIGLVKEAEVRNLYQKSSVFALPAIVDAGPKAVLEAMASRLPVIVSTNMGYSEIIQDGKEGFIVQPRDVVMIADKIKKLNSDRNLMKKMGVEAEKTAKNYNGDYHGYKVMEHIKYFYSLKSSPL